MLHCKESKGIYILSVSQGLGQLDQKKKELKVKENEAHLPGTGGEVLGQSKTSSRTGV